MAEVTGPSSEMKRGFWRASLTTFGGLFLALVCLRQWGVPHPWSRLDLYSGGFLVTAVLIRVGQATTFHRAAFRSKEVLQEALGGGYDPDPLRLWSLLPVADLAVILDYSHWHLVPALEQRALQDMGLGLGILGAAWMIWTDTYLARHFCGGLTARKLMTDGPFGLVRHPRYAGILLGKVASPLLFASMVGWLLFPFWLFVIATRIRREEAHLRELFGAEYDAHARRTSRLLPGIY